MEEIFEAIIENWAQLMGAVGTILAVIFAARETRKQLKRQTRKNYKKRTARMKKRRQSCKRTCERKPSSKRR